MKRHLWAGLLLLFTAPALPGARLEAQLRVTPFVGGGLVKGTSDLGRDTKNGWVASGGVDLPIGQSGFSFIVDASYGLIRYQGAFDESMKVTTALGEVRYEVGASTPAAMVHPYLRGGVGVISQSYEPGKINARSTTQTRAAFGVGAGLDLHVGPPDLQLGARLVSGTDAGFFAVEGALSYGLGGQP